MAFQVSPNVNVTEKGLNEYRTIYQLLLVVS